MVFQDPSTALNPTLTIGRQVTEVLTQHRGLSASAAWHAAIEALRHVHLRDPEQLMRRYPHQISGGEKQRVVIATAFACQPELIIFDEPTSALDVITGARILALFAELRQQTGVAALYISHDLALVSRVADRVADAAGRQDSGGGAADTVFRAPPSRLHASPGGRRYRARNDAWYSTSPGDGSLLRAEKIEVRYARHRLFRAAPPLATRDIRFTIRPGEILGVVGESGSGKSSLARALTGLAAFGGGIEFAGRMIAGPRDMDRAYRRAVQIVFQHPDASLNPRQTIGQILARPLRLFGGDVRTIPALLGTGASAGRPMRGAIRTSFPAARSNASPSPAPSPRVPDW